MGLGFLNKSIGRVTRRCKPNAISMMNANAFGFTILPFLHLLISSWCCCCSDDDSSVDSLSHVGPDHTKVVDDGNCDCDSFPGGPNVVDPDHEPLPRVIALM